MVPVIGSDDLDMSEAISVGRDRLEEFLHQFFRVLFAHALGDALGQEVQFNNVTPETYRGFGFPGSDDLGNMFQFYRDFEKECNSVRDVSYSKELNPELQSFDQWLSKNAQNIPLN